MSERIYGWLLALYPRRFREEYGDAMRQVFRDRLKTENPLVLWAEVLRDLVVSVPREHWRPRQPAAASTGFTLSEEAVRQIAKRSHHGSKLSAATTTLILGAVVGLLGNAPPWPMLSIFSAMLVYYWMTTIKMRDRNRRHWSGFEVILETGRISVAQFGTTKTLLKAEVRMLKEMPGFGLLIQPEVPERQLMLPSLLTGYQEVRETLLTWAPIKTVPGPTRLTLFMRWELFLTIYVLALLVRSPYYLYPITCIASAGLLFYLRLAWLPSKLRLIPLALLLPLVVNAVFAAWH